MHRSPIRRERCKIIDSAKMFFFLSTPKGNATEIVSLVSNLEIQICQINLINLEKATISILFYFKAAFYLSLKFNFKAITEAKCLPILKSMLTIHFEVSEKTNVLGDTAFRGPTMY